MLTEIRESVFGYDSWRPGQEALIRADIEGRYILAVLPTGAGKTLCYQLPASVLDATTVVVTPLIALMQDQERRALEHGMRAVYLSHTLGRSEMYARICDAIKEPPHLLYVSPERFIEPEFLHVLFKMRVRRVVIDEAHCMAEHIEFRPAYAALQPVIASLGVPVSAFTATATAATRALIRERLGMTVEPYQTVQSFDRRNLYYEVYPKLPALYSQMREYIAEKGGSGIIYRNTRAEVEKTWHLLAGQGIECVPYHAGLPAEARTFYHRMFIKREVDVVIATIAYGMGIDKPDIRWVLHADLPKSVEGYYQESGRAGRDGADARCTLLWDPADVPLLRSFADRIENAELRAAALDRLGAVIQYANHDGCRRAYLLRYFEEQFAGSCLGCDFCKRGVFSVG